MSSQVVHLSGLPSAERYKLGASWGLGNNLMAYPVPVVRAPTASTHNQESSSGFRGGPNVQLQNVTWETTLYEPVFRKLVNESLTVFLNLQKMSRDEEGISSAPLIRISRQYRSILRDCQEQLDKNADKSRDGVGIREGKKHRDHSEILYKLELVWNLVEILFIEKTPCGTVIPQLLNWIGQHFPQCDEKARNVLAGSGSSNYEQDREEGGDFLERPETHPDYWEAIILYILQAKMDLARKLLSLHAEFDSDPFVSLDELLRKMPIYNSGMSLADFEFRWRHWQNEVSARINEGDFSTEPHLAEVAEILAGSAEIFQDKILETCETWYEWMVGKLLYTNPSIKIYDLSHFAEEAIGKFGGLSSMTALDSVILAAMELDIPQVMNELCTTLDNLWFPAHLLDLLHHADQLQEGPSSERSDLQAGESLREFLLLEYATCLMSNSSLWQVGVLYLDNCPVQGRQRLELLLERIPLINEKRAEKVLAIASERGMTIVTTSACKVMGIRALRADRIGTAMAWGLRSQDGNFTTFLADQLLQRYCAHGSFSAEDLLDHLGSCMVVSDRLTFLAKYREFHRICQASDFKAAATLLHSLLWSRLAPKYFWVTLLVDALPFLCISEEQSEIYFSSAQTFELMHCLEELVQEIDLPKKQQLLLEDQEKRIRLKLSKNLALALMAEGDSNDGFCI